jgi:hypothetical protein
MEEGRIDGSVLQRASSGGDIGVEVFCSSPPLFCEELEDASSGMSKCVVGVGTWRTKLEIECAEKSLALRDMTIMRCCSSGDDEVVFISSAVGIMLVWSPE